MSGEMKVNRWRLPLIIGAAVVLAAAIGVGVGMLIAHDRNAKPSPAAFASQTPSPSVAAATDKGSQMACFLNNAAEERDNLLDPDAVGAIRVASQESSNDTIRIKAALLSEQQKIAIAAKGHADEAASVLRLETASLELKTACINAGY